MSDFFSKRANGLKYEVGKYIVNTRIEYTEHMMFDDEQSELIDFVDDDEIIMQLKISDHDENTNKEINIRFPEKDRYNLVMYLREVADMLENN
jgi:hypothetical protein